MKKVLVIDDDPDILESMSLIFRYSGFDVHTKPDIHRLLEDIESFQPDIILLDVFLGVADGTDVCINLKAYPPTQTIPVLMVSAHSNAEEIMSKCPADGFLPKPFDIDELIGRVNKLIDVN
ncbi:MAG: response regulator transcription factor [Ilyomonas sp.]